MHVSDVSRAVNDAIWPARVTLLPVDWAPATCSSARQDAATASRRGATQESRCRGVGERRCPKDGYVAIRFIHHRLLHSITYAASVSQIRQKTRAVVKQALKEISIKVDLDQLDATSFFDTSGGNEQNLNHFYWDIAMWSSEPSSLTPITWMANRYAGPEGANISQAENDWQEQNVQRYQGPEYDALYAQLDGAGSAEEAQQLLIRINDHLIANAVSVPILIRSFYTAVANRPRLENLAFEDPFVAYFWSIANWNEASAE